MSYRMLVCGGNFLGIARVIKLKLVLARFWLPFPLI